MPKNLAAVDDAEDVATKAYVDANAGGGGGDLPQGHLGSAEVTSNVGSITTSTVVVASHSITIGAGRRVRVMATWPWIASTVAGDRLKVSLDEDGNVNAEQYLKVDAANNGQQGGTIFAEFTPAEGASRTYAFRAVRHSGSGSFTVIAGIDAPIRLTIEDIGPT